MRKTGNKYKIEECRACYESHTGFSGKLDVEGKEYVVCSNQKMMIDTPNMPDKNRWIKLADAKSV